MKKHLFMTAAVALCALTACHDDDTDILIDDNGNAYTLSVLTFEDADYLGSGNYLGQKNWSSLIDDPQYGGPLLYGSGDDAFVSTPYCWYDQANTNLYASISTPSAPAVYWNGGEAISNYVIADYATREIGYTEQLGTPAGGYNGSKNYCVHNGNFDNIYYLQPRGGIWFEDGVARVIDHMYVCLTSYQLSAGILGNAYCPKATDTDWVKLVAIGTDAQGNTTQLEKYMCQDGRFVEDWSRWDLSALGAVVRLDFNITSSMVGEYGLNFPAYFAYDDVAVRMPL